MLGRQNIWVTPTGLPCSYLTVTWLLASGPSLLASPEPAFVRRQDLKNFVCVVDWRWHELWCFAAGIAEHDPDRPPLILIAGGVDALRDVGDWHEARSRPCISPVKSSCIADAFDRARAALDRVLASAPRTHRDDNALVVAKVSQATRV